MSSVRRLPWVISLQLALRAFLRSCVGTAGRLLPRSIKDRLVWLARLVDPILERSVKLQFDAHPFALAGWRPIFPAAEFASGPIILVNNALAAGGVERQVVNTLRGLEHNGVSAGLLCLRLHEDPKFDFFLPALENGSGFVRNVMTDRQAQAELQTSIPADALARMQAAIGWMPGNVQNEVLRFAAEFASLKPSVVHAWQDSTSIAAAYGAWLVGVPRILVSSRNLVPTNFAYFRPYMLYAYREIASCAPIIMINNSEAGARDYARWLDVPFDRFVVKHNGIDTGAMKRPPAEVTSGFRAKLGIPADARIVGSIFRFYAEKRPLLWIETAARISKQYRDCHFVMFGEGPQQAEVLVAANQHGFGDRLHLPGNIADPALGLSLFDVFLLTSKFEGTPNVVLEASLLGIPVVATDAGGTREAIMENVTGQVAVADPEELAQHVLAILDNPTWSARVRTEGPAFVAKRFGLARMLDETMSLYRSTSP